MSGARKFYEKFQQTFKLNSSGKIQEITFPEKNETAKFKRSKSGRYKQAMRPRCIITDITFVPFEDEDVQRKYESTSNISGSKSSVNSNISNDNFVGSQRETNI